MFLNKYAIAIKLVAFGLLIGALLWVKIDLAKTKGDLALKTAEAAQLKKTNEQNARVIEGFTQQRIDNDAIAEAIAARLNLNRAQTEKVRVQLKEARNDPTVRDWAAMPVPDLVKRLLNEELTGDGISQPAR